MDNMYWHSLYMIPGVGPQTYKKLLEKFENPKEVWMAKKNLLKTVLGETKVLENILLYRKKINIELEYEKLIEKNIQIINYKNNEYPDSLKKLYSLPPVLYYKGNISLLHNDKILAIVGSRKPSLYGVKAAQLLSKQLSDLDFTIVSGMARGIDSASHWGSLTKSSKTIAVLGSGIDIVYPRENDKLYNNIIKNGLVISEFPPGTNPDARNFPRRNRIISGLAMGVLVVEAAQKSGSLITADFALEQGKDVFAIPGSIFSSQSKGTNNLIKQGAKIVTKIQDILEEYKIYDSSRLELNYPLVNLSTDEKSILNFLGLDPVCFDEIKNKTNFRTEKLLSLLSLLELKGVIEKIPGSKYIINIS